MPRPSQSLPDSVQTRRFVSSRITRGNKIFRNEIEVSPVQVVKTKRSWLSKTSESISIRHVSSVRVRTGVLFAEIWIESSGGTNQIHSSGHTRADALEIKRLIEEHQRAYRDREPEEAGIPPEPAGTRSCPFCAEEIRAQAIICRFCQRDLPP